MKTLYDWLAGDCAGVLVDPGDLVESDYPYILLDVPPLVTSCDAIDDAIDHDLLRAELNARLDDLSPREKCVLQLRFGLEDGKAYTLKEVGKKVGVARESICRIEVRALRKLRHPSRSRKLLDYL